MTCVMCSRVVGREHDDERAAAIVDSVAQCDDSAVAAGADARIAVGRWWCTACSGRVREGGRRARMHDIHHT
jgi:hypothetical protein